MMINTSFFTLVLMILCSIFTVKHAAAITDLCPSKLDFIDMCSEDSIVEDSKDGSKVVDSVLLRITKQQNNCICHVTLQKSITNYMIYMSKYEGLSNAAPNQQNCGLAVDVEIVDLSETIRSLEPIECTSGTSLRSISLGGSELKLKSRIVGDNFTRGYCMQISRNHAIYSCNMKDQRNKAGADVDWIETNGTHHTSFDECKKYCLQTDICVAVHYESTYCFVYNKTTTLTNKTAGVYSQKYCVDTQKLQIRCYSTEVTHKTSQGTTAESTTKTSQGYPLESTTKTSQETTAENDRSTKTDTETTSINDSPMTSSYTKSTIMVKNDTTKDEGLDLFIYLGAAAGGVLMILLIVCIIVCIRKRSNQTSLKETQHYSTQKLSDENRDSDYDSGGLKDNVLYVSSEPNISNEILEDGNYNTIDLEQTRRVNQNININGDYSTVDGTCSIIGSYSDSSLSKSKPVIKPKPKPSFKSESVEETIHLSTMDNSNSEYAVVDKGRNSDAVKNINSEHGSGTEYAVVNKVKKSSNNN